MQHARYNMAEYSYYRDKIYLALRGELRVIPRGDDEPFNERNFLESCFKGLGALSEKQRYVLDRLLERIFR